MICPKCKEEIDELSHYCDQCGQQLFYCSVCGKVGLGRRCIYCGGEMLNPKDVHPVLMLVNDHDGIKLTGIDGAVLGRREGPYSQTFVQNPYISGRHAQLSYKPQSGWCITDLHSSNGTQINQTLLQPDVPNVLHDGDTLVLATLHLQVKIN